MNEMTVKTEVVDKKALTTLKSAQKFTINNERSKTLAWEFLRGIKGVQKEINETFDPGIKKAHETHKTLVATKAQHSQPLVDAEKILKGKLLDYDTEQEKITREKQRKAEEEARKKAEEEALAEAEALAKEGRSEEAEAVLTEPVSTPAPVVQGAKKQKGESYSESWEVQVINVKLLAKAVADGHAPINTITPNLPTLRAMARAMKTGFNIPGVKTYTKKRLNVRST